MDINETTRAYLPDSQDDLTDTALTAIEHRKALRDLVALARFAAPLIERTAPRTAQRLRYLADKVAKHTT